MAKEKIAEKLNQTGHKIDDWVEHTSAKHNYPKWKVWLGICIAALAVVGAVKFLL